MQSSTTVKAASRLMSRDIFKSLASLENHRRQIGRQDEEEIEEGGSSVEVEDLRAQLQQLKDSLRQRDDEIYYLNEEIRQLQNENEDMEERLERYKQLAGPLPPTAEVLRAMATSNDRAMRQVFGRKGAEKLNEQEPDPNFCSESIKTVSSKSTVSEPAPSTVTRPSTSSSSSRGLGAFIRKVEGFKRSKGASEGAPPAKRRVGRPNEPRVLGDVDPSSTSQSADVADNASQGQKIAITIDSDSDSES
ncbi:hypothetical protein BKA64DRAFT_642562 [Cadophora sp. MPI-SDFR-AT-0126]|nr:hypothetical protein BKA64DRAFT_642562 [Leotiomycetes sp. MPI-SDFR-AT-0126]